MRPRLSNVVARFGNSWWCSASRRLGSPT